MSSARPVLADSARRVLAVSGMDEGASPEDIQGGGGLNGDAELNGDADPLPPCRVAASQPDASPAGLSSSKKNDSATDSTPACASTLPLRCPPAYRALCGCCSRASPGGNRLDAACMEGGVAPSVAASQPDALPGPSAALSSCTKKASTTERADPAAVRASSCSLCVVPGAPPRARRNPSWRSASAAPGPHGSTAASSMGAAAADDDDEHPIVPPLAVFPVDDGVCGFFCNHESATKITTHCQHSRREC